MTRDAELHRDEDRKRKEEIEARNTADARVYTTEKALRDAGDKVPANVKDDVNSQDRSAARGAVRRHGPAGDPEGHQRAACRRSRRSAPRCMRSQGAGEARRRGAG